MSELMDATIDNAYAYVAFAAVVCALYGAAIVLLLFFLLAVRVGWRWLTRHTWSDVVRSVERKALR